MDAVAPVHLATLALPVMDRTLTVMAHLEYPQVHRLTPNATRALKFVSVQLF